MRSDDFRKGPITITAYDWVPGFAQGQVRDLRLRWALKEAGFDYAVELLPQGTQEQPENVVRQPFGQVPALTVGSETMFESGACLWRIAEASETLLPAEPADRDRCLSWLFAALNTVEPPLGMMAMLWFFEQMPDAFGIADGKAAAIVRPGAKAGADKRLAQFALALGGRETIVGERFTVADLMMTAVLLIADWMRLLDSHPEVKAYFDRHTARAAFRQAQAEQMAPFAENAAKYEKVA